MLPLRDLCVLEYHMVILQFEVAGIQILFLFLCQVPVHENQHYGMAPVDTRR